MNTDDLTKYKIHLKKKLERLYNVFAKAAVGDFSSEVEIPDQEDEFTELYAGIQIMLEVIREKISELEVLNKKLTRTIEERSSALREAQKIARVGSLEIDIKSGKLDWSEEMYEIFGLDMNKVSITQELFMNFVHPHDRINVESETAKTIKTHVSSDFFYRIILPGGETKVIHRKARVVLDESGKARKIRGTGQDVTEQKQIEDALINARMDLEKRVKERTQELQSVNVFLKQEMDKREQAEEHVRQLNWAVNKTNNAILIADKNGKIEWVNEGFTLLTGYSLEEVKETYATILNPNELTGLHPDSAHYKQLIKTKKPVSYEVKNFSKTGDEYWTLTTLSPILDSNNNIEKIIAIDSDITKRKIVEKELIKANILVEQTMKAKDAFFAKMSHEIRTPMNAVMGITNLMLKTPLNEIQQQYITAVKKSSENLLVIINDVLDFSKIGAGKILFESIDYNIKTLLESVIDTLRYKAEEKGLELKFSIDPNIPEYLKGDPVRLNQILLNLAGNAVKFTDKGSVQILCNCLKEDAKTVHTEFVVADTGIGIPENKMENVFESFSQAGDDTTRKFGGSGLGLAIAKQLVELQKGRITLKSEEGKGTTFTFTLPCLKGSGKRIESEKQSLNAKQLEGLSSVKILLAEDNEFNRLVAINTLKSLVKGIQVDVAENGVEAIEKLSQNSYHIVLMDVQMPVMNGYDATIYIRKKMKFPVSGIPIIALTANVSQKDIDRCKQAGMNDFIGKPFREYDLLNKIYFLVNKTPLKIISNPDFVKQPEPTSIEKSNNRFTDLEHLRSISNGSDSYVKEMLELFIQQTNSSLDIIKTCMKENDFQKLGAIAHRMRPSFHFVGVVGMDVLTKEIEELSESQSNKEKISPLCSELEVNCKRAILELQEELTKFS